MSIRYAINETHLYNLKIYKLSTITSKSLFKYKRALNKSLVTKVPPIDVPGQHLLRKTNYRVSETLVRPRNTHANTQFT